MATHHDLNPTPLAVFLHYMLLEFNIDVPIAKFTQAFNPSINKIRIPYLFFRRVNVDHMALLKQMGMPCAVFFRPPDKSQVDGAMVPHDQLYDSLITVECKDRMSPLSQTMLTAIYERAMKSESVKIIFVICKCLSTNLELDIFDQTLVLHVTREAAFASYGSMASSQRVMVLIELNVAALCL